MTEELPVERLGKTLHASQGGAMGIFGVAYFLAKKKERKSEFAQISYILLT